MSLRPYPEAELEAMWADSESRYFGDLVGNGGLAEDEARAKAAKDTVWLRGLDPLLFEIEHEGARVGRVVLWLDAFEQPGNIGIRLRPFFWFVRHHRFGYETPNQTLQ